MLNIDEVRVLSLFCAKYVQGFERILVQNLASASAIASFRGEAFG